MMLLSNWLTWILRNYHRKMMILSVHKKKKNVSFKIYLYNLISKDFRLLVTTFINHSIKKE